MAASLRALTRMTSSGPLADVTLHTWPDESCADESLGRTNAGMRKTMKRVEYSATKNSWDERSSRAGAGVDDQFGRGGQTRLPGQLQAGRTVDEKLAQLGIVGLRGGNVGQGDGRVVSDGRNSCS